MPLAAPRPRIVASVLPADFARLGEECLALQQDGIDRIQWDVMDGVFVPNLTVGPDVIAAVRARVGVEFEAHLMVSEPDTLLTRWVDAGCGTVIVHAEACRHLHRTLAAVRETGARAGVAVNPATPLAAVAHVLDLVDQLLVMTVNPGFGGQAYLASMEPKIAEAAALLRTADHEIELEVDGGINRSTIAGAATAGATTFVAGTALFRGSMAEEIAELRRVVEAAGTGEAAA